MASGTRTPVDCLFLQDATQQPQQSPSEDERTLAVGLDILSASDALLLEEVRTKGGAAEAARRELSIRAGVYRLTTTELEHLPAEGGPDPRFEELARREHSHRVAVLAIIRNARRGALRKRFGHLPLPNARAFDEARQVYAAILDVGFPFKGLPKGNRGFAVMVAILSDGSSMVAISGGEEKALTLRDKVTLPDHFHWAEDWVSFRRDDFVPKPDGSPFHGGRPCAEPKIFLSKADNLAVISQATFWYGREHKHDWPGLENGLGSLMLPCRSCHQHSERFMKAPSQLRY